MTKSKYSRIDVNQAREANKGQEPTKTRKRSEDKRFWKPVVNKKVEGDEYQAMIRLLPQGEAGVEDSSMPFAVEQQMHYIKEPHHNLYLFVKCRKTLGENEPCPICETNWAIWRDAKNRKDKEMEKKATSRQAQTSFIGNVLIIQDLKNPENDGQVRLWDHTRRIHGWLTDPMNEPTEEEKKEEGFKKKKEKEIFTPHCVVEGRNYIVIANVDNETNMVSYKDSFWDDQGLTPLAASDDEIASILNQCYDLKEFLNDVPSAESLATMYQAFNQKLRDAGGPAFSDEMMTKGVATPKVASGNATEFLKETPQAALESEKSENEDKQEESAPAPETDPVGDAPGGEEDELPF